MFFNSSKNITGFIKSPMNETKIKHDMEGAAWRTHAPQQGLSWPPRGPSASRRPPQQGSNTSSQNSHSNQLKLNVVIDRGNHSKREKQAEAGETLTRMVEKTWVGGFNTSNNTTNNTTTELKPIQPSFRRNLHSPGFIQLNQLFSLGPKLNTNLRLDTTHHHHHSYF